MNSIAADSSMYICFNCDIPGRNCLNCILDNYKFYIGQNILEEIEEIMPTNLLNKIELIDFDFFKLVEPFFGRSGSHKTDGEYEAMGLAIFLNSLGTLRYVVIDESRARHFLINNFPEIKDKMVGSIGLIRDSCLTDKKLDVNTAVKTLEQIVERVGANNEHRPCGVDNKFCIDVLIPLISIMKNG